MIKDIHQRFSITILANDYVAKSGLLAEHGLSFLIECGDRKILFDTGQGLVLEQNASRLNVNLSDIKQIALSHGHYDHSGGLGLWQKNKGVHVYSHPGVFNKRFNKSPDNLKEVGIPFSREDLEANGMTFVLSNKPQTINEGFILSGEIPRGVPYWSSNFLTQGQNGLEKDMILDDQFFLIATSWGNIMLMGCNHSGVQNSLSHAMTLVENKKILALIGGFHLLNADEKEIDTEMKRLKEGGVEYVMPLHCSGLLTMYKAKELFKDRCLEGSVGCRLKLVDGNLILDD